MRFDDIDSHLRKTKKCFVDETNRAEIDIRTRLLNENVTHFNNVVLCAANRGKDKVKIKWRDSITRNIYQFPKFSKAYQLPITISDMEYIIDYARHLGFNVKVNKLFVYFGPIISIDIGWGN